MESNLCLEVRPDLRPIGRRSWCGSYRCLTRADVGGLKGLPNVTLALQDTGTGQDRAIPGAEGKLLGELG